MWEGFGGLSTILPVQPEEQRFSHSSVGKEHGFAQFTLAPKNLNF